MRWQPPGQILRCLEPVLNVVDMDILLAIARRMMSRLKFKFKKSNASTAKDLAMCLVTAPHPREIAVLNQEGEEESRVVEEDVVEEQGVEEHEVVALAEIETLANFMSWRMVKLTHTHRNSRRYRCILFASVHFQTRHARGT